MYENHSVFPLLGRILLCGDYFEKLFFFIFEKTIPQKIHFDPDKLCDENRYSPLMINDTPNPNEVTDENEVLLPPFTTFIRPSVREEIDSDSIWAYGPFVESEAPGPLDPDLPIFKIELQVACMMGL